MDRNTGGSATENTRLVQRCLAGDAAAWTELVDRYAALVHSVPVRYGLNAMEVDDIGQEVFLVLAQNLHQVEDPERLPAWLLTTTRRVTWRFLQKRRQEQVPDADDLQVSHALDVAGDQATSASSLLAAGKTAPTMQELLDGWAYQDALQQGFSHLGGRCRRLLRLLFLDAEEPSYEEIAERLEMPVGSIGPTRNRCLEKLRTILVGLGFDDLL